jgi:hypothetical protein
MPASDEDDFSAFAGREQMFFGLRDPYGLIRGEVEQALREQVPDAEVIAITTQAEPKFLTLGKQGEPDPALVVTHFAFCFRASLTVLFDAGRKGEVLHATLTFMFADVNVRGRERVRTHFDLHAEAERSYLDEELFKRRFLAFRGLSTA